MTQTLSKIDSIPTWTCAWWLQICLFGYLNCISAWANQCVLCVAVCQKSSPTNYPPRMWVGLSASVRHHAFTVSLIHIQTTHTVDICHLLFRDRATTYMAQYLNNLLPERTHFSVFLSVCLPSQSLQASQTFLLFSFRFKSVTAVSPRTQQC